MAIWRRRNRRSAVSPASCPAISDSPQIWLFLRKATIRLMIGLRATEFARNGTKHFWPLREIVLKQNPGSKGRRRIAGPNREPSAMIKLLPILTLLTCLTFASFAPALMSAFAN
jgi:hypothetical protein